MTPEPHRPSGTLAARSSGATKAAILLLALCGLPTGEAAASSASSIALGKLTQQYHFEIIATACARQGLLDPKVVTEMQQAEARLAKQLPPGVPIEQAKAAIAPNAKHVASMIGPSTKLFCQGMANEIVH